MYSYNHDLWTFLFVKRLCFADQQMICSSVQNRTGKSFDNKLHCIKQTSGRILTITSQVLRQTIRS